MGTYVPPWPQVSYNSVTIYIAFLAGYILSQVSARPSTFFVTISDGTAWEQLMDISQV